jgi:hypothetical protein
VSAFRASHALKVNPANLYGGNRVAARRANRFQRCNNFFLVNLVLVHERDRMYTKVAQRLGEYKANHHELIERTQYDSNVEVKLNAVDGKYRLYGIPQSSF